MELLLLPFVWMSHKFYVSTSSLKGLLNVLCTFSLHPVYTGKLKSPSSKPKSKCIAFMLAFGSSLDLSLNCSITESRKGIKVVWSQYSSGVFDSTFERWTWQDGLIWFQNRDYFKTISCSANLKIIIDCSTKIWGRQRR